ncbi:MAG: methylmalonyl Co-A mutase-associated GTPase MeaB [Bacteroidales bacterium]|nr:methylmalonyl Co-A mutase-associated GTPase MeaB [Bacteroidales bacterium]
MKGIPGDKNTDTTPGSDKPSDVSEESVRIFKKRKRTPLSVDEYVEGILSGNRTILGKAITLIESSLPGHMDQGQEIIEKCLPDAGRSMRIGITGIPGAGKSTFIEALGLELVRKQHRLAVLAVDPSSEQSKGSILGDKTRMEHLSADANTFIRPSPSAGSLGGVARKTREAIILCEAAGYDTVFVETIGVGQSEIAVHSMVDFFLLLMLAGAGDELQGIKRGIMEMADCIAITKADGMNAVNAERAKAEYERALHLFPPKESGWVPKVFTCSAINGTGINEIWNDITDYRKHALSNGFFEARRKEQSRYWMYETINQSLRESFYHDQEVQRLLEDFEKKVQKGEITPFVAAKILLKKYFKRRGTH